MNNDILLSGARDAGLEFRAIRDADMDFLCRLYSSTRAEELAQVPWPQEQRDHFLAMQFEAQHEHYMRHYGKADFLLIMKDGCPIGRLYIDEWDDEIRLIDIALLPVWRGRGYGRTILGDLMEIATDRGKAVRAHVEKANPAHRLYAQLGYRVIEDKQIYDLMEWSPEPLVSLPKAEGRVSSGGVAE